MYWAFVTLSTLGYGDIVPTRLHEKYFAILTSYVGCLVFAFVIGELTMLATRQGASSIALRKRMESLEEFMRFYKVGRLVGEGVF
jgi:hypothetical protein